MFYNFKKYLSSSTTSNEELDESEEVVEIKEQQHSEPRPKAQVEPSTLEHTLLFNSYFYYPNYTVKRIKDF